MMTPTRLRILAFSGILIAIFLPHLTDFNYGFGSYEMIAFTAGAFVIGTLLGMICRIQIIFGFVLGYLIYVFVDSYFLEPRWAISCLLICYFLTPVLVRHIPNGFPLVVFVFGCVFGLPSFFAPSDPFLVNREAEVAVVSSDRAEVAYLHIILDEQLSPIVDHPTMPPVVGREEVIETYLVHDFRLYGRADSVAQETYQAVSAIFGLSENDDNHIKQPEDNPYIYVVDDNQLVQRLLDSGFAPTIIGSNYLGLCSEDPRVTCRRYAMNDMMAGAELMGWRPFRRLQYAMIALSNNYIWGSRLLIGYRGPAILMSRLFGWQYQPYESMMATVTNLSLLEGLPATVAGLERGDALIAHLLVPHRPFVLDRDCSFNDLPDWRYPLFRHTTQLDPSSYEAFWDQSICTHRRLTDVLEAVEGRDDLIIIVHGDHGSRILSKTEMNTHVDSRATLLAVRAPGIEPGLMSSTVSLQARFADIIGYLLPADQAN